jgi:hypothetical protein
MRLVWPGWWELLATIFGPILLAGELVSLLLAAMTYWSTGMWPWTLSDWAWFFVSAALITVATPYFADHRGEWVGT